MISFKVHGMRCNRPMKESWRRFKMGEDEVKWIEGVSENYDDTEFFVDEDIEKMESDIRLRERREVNEEQEKLRERRRINESRRESISLLTCQSIRRKHVWENL